MIEFAISRLFPDYLLRDKTGYAMAKAIERAMTLFCETVQCGIDMVQDVEKMPEWRLDEMAWEYNCPYDYNAAIEAKRRWIREADTLSELYGTSEGISRYMEGYFDAAALQEAWEYGGEAFHFRMLFPGSWTPEKVSWASTAIETVKNVRSVLDIYQFRSEWLHKLYAGCALYAREQGTFQIAVVDMSDVNWYVDELGEMLLDENGVLLIVEG